MSADQEQTKEPTSAEIDAERKALETAISSLERENKSLQGQVESASAEKLEELKTFNKELKASLIQVEKDIATELRQRKIPMDAGSISDKLQVFKAEVLAYCADRSLDPALWKKLESL